MSKKIEAIEERIESRKKKIEKYQEGIKREKEGLKKDEKTLIHLKYNDVLQKMIANNIDPGVIEKAIEEKLEDTADGSEVDNGSQFN